MMQVELKAVIRAAREQGWRVEDRGDRFAFFPPDRSLSPVIWHRTQSDWRAARNFMGHLRQRGFIWPWPPRG